MRSIAWGTLLLAVTMSAAMAQTAHPAAETAASDQSQVPATAADETQKVSGDQLLAELASTQACNAGKLMSCAKLKQDSCDVAMASGIPECVDSLRPDLAGKQLETFEVSFATGQFQGCLLAKVMKASKVPAPRLMSCLMGR